MRFEAIALDGAWLIYLEPIQDDRGFFARTFCVNEFRAHGLETEFSQHSISCSLSKGAVRGMHFQREPHSEVKLVRCLSGSIWDVIIDVRSGSPTYRSWRGFELSEANGAQLYIPKGFAHGFQTLTDNASVNYLTSEFHAPNAAAGIRYDDPTFGINWPLPVSIIADKDLRWPAFEA